MSKWISVGIHFPQNGKNVVVMNDKCEKYMIAFYDGRDRCFFYSAYSQSFPLDVTHWRKFPYYDEDDE